MVEVASPGDSRREINDKALMWLSYGARLVWVVHPDTRTVDAHREGAGALTLTQSDVLHGFDALPGFTCEARDSLRRLTCRCPSRAIPRPLSNTRNRSHGQDRRPCRYRHHDGRDPGLRPAWHIPCGA